MIDLGGTPPGDSGRREWLPVHGRWLMRGLRAKAGLVRGGPRGMGLAAAERFLEEGSRVFVAGLLTGEVDAAVAVLAQRGDVAGLACDVSAPAEVSALVDAAEEALAGIDVLINNAGTARRDRFLDIAVAEWDRILAVNLRGMVVGARWGTWRMPARGRGVIFNTSSTNGLAAEEDSAPYNAPKAGVPQLPSTM